MHGLFTRSMVFSAFATPPHHNMAEENTMVNKEPGVWRALSQATSEPLDICNSQEQKTPNRKSRRRAPDTDDEFPAAQTEKDHPDLSEVEDDIFNNIGICGHGQLPKDDTVVPPPTPPPVPLTGSPAPGSPEREHDILHAVDKNMDDAKVKMHASLLQDDAKTIAQKLYQ